MKLRKTAAFAGINDKHRGQGEGPLSLCVHMVQDLRGNGTSFIVNQMVNNYQTVTNLTKSLSTKTVFSKTSKVHIQWGRGKTCPVWEVGRKDVRCTGDKFGNASCIEGLRRLVGSLLSAQAHLTGEFMLLSWALTTPCRRVSACPIFPWIDMSSGCGCSQAALDVARSYEGQPGLGWRSLPAPAQRLPKEMKQALASFGFWVSMLW